jgi:DNA polymerase-1
MAFVSKEIATIYNEVPLNINNLEDLKYEPKESEELYHLYEELEFYSLLKKFPKKEVETNIDDIKKIDSISELELDDIVAFYIETDEANYHKGNILGMALTDKFGTYYIKKELIKECIVLLKDKILYTFDLKKNIVLLNKLGVSLSSVNFDLMLATYLLNYAIKDDIAYLMKNDGCNVNMLLNLKEKICLNFLVQLKCPLFLFLLIWK